MSQMAMHLFHNAPYLILGALLVSGSTAPAESATHQTNWPKEVVVTVGDIRTRIDGPKLWTMSGIDYQNTVMATADSAYGTVITIRGVGHLGTAHFIDVPGKPGEVEKEDVTSLKFLVDGKPVTEFTPQMNLTGTSFRMDRTSKIRDLDLESSVSIRDGVLIETAHLRAKKAIDLQMTYPLMYAWNPKAAFYMFGDENGMQKQGVFRKEGQSDEPPEKTARWMAVFNPASGKGSVCYLLKRPTDADAWLQWTDAPAAYRKLRIMSFVEKVMPAGFDGTYQAVVGFFSATEQDWEKATLAKVAELKKASPDSP